MLSVRIPPRFRLLALLLPSNTIAGSSPNRRPHRLRERACRLVVAMDYRPPSSPIAEAMNWVSRIITVALMTLLPILGGRWLDGKRATNHWALVGLFAGLLLGSYQLWLIVREANKSQQKKRDAAKSIEKSSDVRRTDRNDRKV